MKRLFATIIAIIFVAGILFFYLMPPQKEVIETESPYNIDTYNRDKKKILIFSSKGGGGHTSVTNALYQYLEHDYCLGTSYIIPHILKSIDVFQKFSNEKVTFEDMHNWLAKKKWFSLLNLEYNLGLWFFALNRKNIEKSIEEYLLAYPPDLIISVVTVANGMVLSVAKKLNIPFLLIPTDLDAFAFLNQLDNPKYDKFHIALSYDKKSIRKQFEQKKIKSDYITYTGFPVKKEFLEPSIPKKYIREAFAIPNNKPVILLMMGSLGSDELLHFSKELSKLSISAHIIIALGKNEQIKAHIEKIKFPALALLISGGHTELILLNSWTEKEKIGETQDDAVGEAFDKVARMLGLPYPGGPGISKLAEEARAKNIYLETKFPRPMIHSKNFNFSFSGLKTSVLYYLKKLQTSPNRKTMKCLASLTEASTRNFSAEKYPCISELSVKKRFAIAREFEDAIVETLVSKTKMAIDKYLPKTLIIGGGVIANKALRENFLKLSENYPEIEILIPEKSLTTDNAAMIAVAGYIEYLKNKKLNKKLKAQGNLNID